MSLINKDKNFCYRITHIDNLQHILKSGICNIYHKNADPNYITIGNPDIINLRDTFQVKIDGFGKIGEYIPFYFTPRSMMLYNIITGIRAPIVPKQNREDILIIRCLINDLAKTNQFFFTDGQANVMSITNHYSELKYLDCIDWDIIQNSDFKKELKDIDKQRRYQAEFLVYHHVPINFIESFNVYNESAKKLVAESISKTDIIKPININKIYYF